MQLSCEDLKIVILWLSYLWASRYNFTLNSSFNHYIETEDRFRGFKNLNLNVICEHTASAFFTNCQRKHTSPKLSFQPCTTKWNQISFYSSTTDMWSSLNTIIWFIVAWADFSLGFLAGQQGACQQHMGWLRLHNSMALISEDKCIYRGFSEAEVILISQWINFAWTHSLTHPIEFQPKLDQVCFWAGELLIDTED